MGGNTTAVGNVRNTTAEFNFFQDPEAAQIVFQEVECPATLLPWEPCINIPITVVSYVIYTLQKGFFDRVKNDSEAS